MTNTSSVNVNSNRAIAVLTKSAKRCECLAEFAMLVSDRHQCQGLGTELLRRLLQVGHQEKIARITANILVDNYGMQRVCAKLGFHIQPTSDSTVMQAEITL